MMFIVILLKNFISFETKKFLLAHLYDPNLFFIMNLMISPVKVWIIERVKGGSIESILIPILTIVANLSLSFHYQE